MAEALSRERRIAVRDDLAELRRRQNGDRGAGAHAERPGGPEHRIDQHRQEGRVESHLHRQAGDGGVGHRLRNDHRGSRQAGDHVQSQPFLAVLLDPIQHR